MMLLDAEVRNIMLFRLKTVGLRLREGFRNNLTNFPPCFCRCSGETVSLKIYIEAVERQAW
jgi:hypothetical protein